MRIAVDVMKGMLPIVEPRKLPNEVAVKAVNCRFDSGSLVPLKGNLAVAATLNASAMSLYRYLDEYWFSWPTKVDAVRNPLANDPYNRVYFTGDGKPKVTYNSIALGAGALPTAAFPLGVPKADAVSVSLVTGDDPLPEEYQETRVYTIRYRTETGDTGAPADPSSAVVIKNTDDEVYITLPQPTENDFNAVSKIIYRSSSSADVVGFRKIAEVPMGQGIFIDSNEVAEGAVLDYEATEGYLPPPEDLHSLTSVGNGVLAGITGNTVCFCEPFLPHAWPKEYREALQFEAVACVGTGFGLAVVTTGMPYFYTGSSSGTMRGGMIESAQACVSKDSLVDMGQYAMYASPDGLVALGGSDATVVTAQVLSHEDWQAYQPETIHAAMWEGRYVGFYGGVGGFIFDPKTGDFSELDFYADHAYTDLKTDTLYLLIDGDLYAFNKGGSLDCQWLSKEWMLNGRGMSSAKVFADEPEKVQLDLLVDGVVACSWLAGEIGSNAFRLPSFRADKIQIKLSGDTAVHGVVLASTMSEI